jgi:hypothetical protein
MNELLKQSGLIIILIGVLLLIVTMAIGKASNSILLWSMIIIIFGLLEYIAVNHFVED